MRRIAALGAAVVTVTGVVTAAPAWAGTRVATDWASLVADVARGGTVQLGADIDNPDGENLSISVNTTLDLNGHALDIEERATGGQAAIVTAEGTETFTVEDTSGPADGVLTATGGNAAGITGYGTVSVTGGTVRATGGPYGGEGIAVYGGAGIVYSVSVTGGTVVATGGQYGAGITPGSDGVRVSGGSVTAAGGEYAAGIGGDNGGFGGTLTVSGGSVTATGGDYGAGIGGGDHGGGNPVTVYSGSVTATGGDNGAGIGGGLGAPGGKLSVYGGSVTATGGADAAGAGDGAFGPPVVENHSQVRIGAGGSLTAANGGRASAIGPSYPPGNAFGTLSNAGSLTIPAGAMLTIPAGGVAENSGTLHLGGTLDGAGTVHNTGVILPTGSGTVAGDGQGPAGTDLLVQHNNYDLSFRSDAAGAANPADLLVYADTVADSEQTLPADPSPPSAGRFTGWFTRPVGGTQVTDSTDLFAVFGAGPVQPVLYAQYTPTVTSVSPAAGPTSGGTSVTITGAGFTGATAVAFGNATPAASFTVVSDTSIVATSPTHTVGLVHVRVSAGGFRSAAVRSAQYRFVMGR